MIGQFRLQRSLQDCFGELFQQAVLADDVFRLLVIGQQLINEGLVDSHRFLILLFRWSFTQLLLQLPVETRTLENQISHWCVFPSASHPCNRRSSSSPDEVPVRSSATVHRWPSSLPWLPSLSCSAR